jgi:hypothetical protein
MTKTTAKAIFEFGWLGSSDASPQFFATFWGQRVRQPQAPTDVAIVLTV